MYEGPANPKMFSTLMFRSNMNPSKLEWAVLFLNSRNLVRRGQMFLAMSVPRNFPCGCSGNDNQKPFSSEPAATLSMKNGFWLSLPEHPQGQPETILIGTGGHIVDENGFW